MRFGRVARGFFIGCAFGAWLLLLAGLATLAVGCGSKPKKPRTVTVETVVRGSLRVPPPIGHGFATVKEGCPEKLICFRPRDANAVARTIEELRSYADQAWDLCGPKNEDEEGEDESSNGSDSE